MVRKGTYYINIDNLSLWAKIFLKNIWQIKTKPYLCSPKNFNKEVF
jgi:hypothetical protein